jgi:hypothetical protein
MPGRHCAPAIPGTGEWSDASRCRRPCPGQGRERSPADRALRAMREQSTSAPETRIGSNCDCVSLHPVLLGELFQRKVRQRRRGRRGAAHDARKGLTSVSGLSRATTSERAQPGRLTEPGSPNCGCSSGVPASASSMLAARAPASSSASASASACWQSVRMLRDSQGMVIGDGQPPFFTSSLAASRCSR